MGALKEAKTAKTKIGTVRMSTKEGLKSKIPDGAEIISKELTISVEEIENGFITTKSYSIRFREPKRDYNDYAYHDVKTFSETNPLEVSEAAAKEAPSLADLFNS